MTEPQLTEEEARAEVAHLIEAARLLRVCLLEFVARRGWSAMGYRTWEECAAAEFKADPEFAGKLVLGAAMERKSN
jgi:hypothetical protein